MGIWGVYYLRYSEFDIRSSFEPVLFTLYRFIKDYLHFAADVKF
jgi:hypothetical protein